jgi:hypothetical protein
MRRRGRQARYFYVRDRWDASFTPLISVLEAFLLFIFGQKSGAARAGTAPEG